MTSSEDTLTGRSDTSSDRRRRREPDDGNGGLMIEHLEVTPLRLSTTAANIKAAGAQIDALLETLTREAATLSMQWSGEAYSEADLAGARGLGATA